MQFKIGHDPRIDPKVLLNREHHNFGKKNKKPETDFKTFFFFFFRDHHEFGKKIEKFKIDLK